MIVLDGERLAGDSLAGESLAAEIFLTGGTLSEDILVIVGDEGMVSRPWGGSIGDSPAEIVLDGERLTGNSLAGESLAAEIFLTGGTLSEDILVIVGGEGIFKWHI